MRKLSGFMPLNGKGERVMVKRMLAVVVCVLVILPVGKTEGAAFLGLGDLAGGGFASYAMAISADGKTVVGYSAVDRPYEDPFQSFIWNQSSGMTALPDQPGVSFRATLAYGVSADGITVVGTSLITDQGFRAAKWTPDSGMITLPEDPFAGGVSGDGSVIVGGYMQSRIWRNGQSESLPYLPGALGGSQANGVSLDGRIVVGTSSSALGEQAYRWTAEEGIEGLGFLPGASISNAHAISGDGSVIVGSAYGYGAYTEAFYWTPDKQMVRIDNVAGGDRLTDAEAVSGNGSIIVGYIRDSSWSDINRAFIWDESNGMRELQSVLASDYGLELPGWRLEVATGVSADGTRIVGIGTNPSGNPEAWMVTIPEPLSISLLALGGFILGRVKR